MNRITRDELLTSEEFLLGNIQFELYHDIKNYLESNGLSQTDFAMEMKVTKGYVSQILNGDFDHKLSKLVHLYKCIGIAVTGLQKVKIEEYLSDDKNAADKLELKQVDYMAFESEQDLELIPINSIRTIERKQYINEQGQAKEATRGSVYI